MRSEGIERRRRTPRDEEIPELLVALSASGGNTAAFARERGLSPWKLYEAQRVAGVKSRGRGRKGGADFAEVEVVGDGAPTPTSAAFELVLTSGHRLLIPAGFEERSLRRLMGVLTSC